MKALLDLESASRTVGSTHIFDSRHGQLRCRRRGRTGAARAGADFASPDTARLVAAGSGPVSRSRHHRPGSIVSAVTSSATRSIKRLHIGTLWAEGPAWNGVGRYLVWSDIPNNVQMRWIEEDGRVTVFRNPSGYSNGNTFDFEGRQLSCEHGGRRVVRYEPNGTITVIAEKFQGKRLNSPNDIVVHPDGGIWFTDPTYGIRGNYEGFKAEQEIKEAVYRVDPKTGQIDKVTDEVGQPNGICFSPDYKKLYVADTGHAARHQGVGRGRQGAAQRQAIHSARHSRNRRAIRGRRHPLRRGRQHLGWRASRRSGDCADRRAHRHDPPAGDLRERLLRRARRNRLFMTASQSLYAVYVETTGAHIT